MAAKFAAFHDTRNLLIESTQYTKPLTYAEWSKQPDSLKAGLLFVQFYNEITLAWDKANTIDFIDAEEGVSTVLQYLEKQVRQTQYFMKDDPSKKASAEFRRKNPDACIAVTRRIIDEKPEKFDPGYIYKVAYNCLYCICHDRKCDHDRLENETSAVIAHDGEELNLFDTISDSRGSAENVSESVSFEKEFWSIIEDTGMSAEKVMRYLLTKNEDDLKALNSRSKRFKEDPLASVEVSLEAVDTIVAELREKFLSLPHDSACGQYISQFASVFA